jgi:hypothetical protein
LTYSNKIDCYSFSLSKIAFTFKASNNMPGSGNVGSILDKTTSLLLFTSNGTVYKMADETSDATVAFITTDFVYDRDKEAAEHQSNIPGGQMARHGYTCLRRLPMHADGRRQTNPDSVRNRIHHGI